MGVWPALQNSFCLQNHGSSTQRVKHHFLPLWVRNKVLKNGEFVALLYVTIQALPRMCRKCQFKQKLRPAPQLINGIVKADSSSLIKLARSFHLLHSDQWGHITSEPQTKKQRPFYLDKKKRFHQGKCCNHEQQRTFLVAIHD